MSFLRPIFRRLRAGRAAALVALGLLCARCVVEHEILGDLGGGQDAGSGVPADGSGLPPVWTDATCFQALAEGASGDACSGSFQCQGAVRSCCKATATCTAGALSLGRICDACPCTNDYNCAMGLWCVNGSCVPCPPPKEVCTPPLFQFIRNGCPWCVTPSTCTSDANCAPGLTCYPGQPCIPGCTDPSCCQGNVCGLPGCGPTAGLDCSVVGCADGLFCNVMDRGETCACVSGQWACSPGSRNTCVPF